MLNIVWDNMASLYAQYLKERTDDKIIESEQGFITYRYLNNDQVYIVDIFVLPEFRKKKWASVFANIVCARAKQNGCKTLIGSVNPSCHGADDSIKVLMAYGMSVYSSTDNLILFRKDL